MNANDLNEFAGEMFGLQEYFDKKLSKVLLDKYFERLQDLSVEEFKAACNAAYDQCRWFPRIVELREFALKADKDHALIAWNIVERVRRRAFSITRRNTKFPLPGIHEAIQLMGGWRKVGMWTENELHFREKEFLERYEVVKRNNFVAIDFDQGGINPRIMLKDVDQPSRRMITHWSSDEE